jgi:hypothetical protein
MMIDSKIGSREGDLSPTNTFLRQMGLELLFKLIQVSFRDSFSLLILVRTCILIHLVLLASRRELGPVVA